MNATHTLRTHPHTTPPTPANTARRRDQIRRAATELTPHAIEQIAQRVTQLLHEHGYAQSEAQPAPARLLDATQLARHLGVTRTWVYEHAHQLGAIRLGTGTKARLRFNLDTATLAIKNLHEPTPRGAPMISRQPGAQSREMNPQGIAPRLVDAFFDLPDSHLQHRPSMISGLASQSRPEASNLHGLATFKCNEVEDDMPDRAVVIHGYIHPTTAVLLRQFVQSLWCTSSSDQLDIATEVERVYIVTHTRLVP